MASDIFMARVEGDTIFYVDYAQSQTKEIGITQKAARALEDALANIVVERDEKHEMLIAAGIIERQKTPEDVAKEALDVAKAAREESAKMADALRTNNEMLERMARMVEDMQRSQQPHLISGSENVGGPIILTSTDTPTPTVPVVVGNTSNNRSGNDKRGDKK